MLSSGNLVWIDLEMTGLEPDRDVIIEIATIVTDAHLNVIEEGPELVIHQSDEILAGMDEWNTSHHTASGLVDRVRASQITTEMAEARTLTFVQAHCYERKAPLCGNSIWQDRRFLHKYMPNLADYLHYRNVDVTSIKELVARWMPHLAFPKVESSHRALDDIRVSIEELKHYREHVFVPHD